MPLWALDRIAGPMLKTMALPANQQMVDRIDA
jgi:hypothetical protein